LIIGFIVVIVAFLFVRNLSDLEPVKAHYTKEYIENNKGKIIVVIPEVYELANIAIAITDYGLNNPYRVNKNGEYYQQVLKHFLPYKKHPLISKIEFSDEKMWQYFMFRESSALYDFKNNPIISGKIYSFKPFIGFFSPFKRHLKLIEDFDKINQRLIKSMVNWRKFIKFKEFDKEL